MRLSGFSCNSGRSLAGSIPVHGVDLTKLWKFTFFLRRFISFNKSWSEIVPRLRIMIRIGKLTAIFAAGN